MKEEIIENWKSHFTVLLDSRSIESCTQLDTINLTKKRPERERDKTGERRGEQELMGKALNVKNTQKAPKAPKGMYTLIHTYIHTYMYAHVHTNIHAYIHTYIHTYAYT